MKLAGFSWAQRRDLAAVASPTPAKGVVVGTANQKLISEDAGAVEEGLFR